MTEWERGQWHAFDKVLALINTYDKKLVPKGDLYDAVMELRPQSGPP